MENYEKKQSLKTRYNDDFFEQAESRRQKLAYERVSVGLVTNERIQHVLDLLYQTHQCYYFGLFKAAINLGVSLLEQSLILLFEELLNDKGEVTIKVFQSFEVVKSSSEFTRYSLSVLVYNALYYRIIDDNNFSNVILLKHIRNKSVHDMLPAFELIDGKYRAVIDKKDKYNIIEIEKKEIDEKLLSTDSEEIYAYFILTRTRKLIRSIFEDRVKKYPPNNL